MVGESLVAVHVDTGAVDCVWHNTLRINCGEIFIVGTGGVCGFFASNFTGLPAMTRNLTLFKRCWFDGDTLCGLRISGAVAVSLGSAGLTKGDGVWSLFLCIIWV